MIEAGLVHHHDNPSDKFRRRSIAGQEQEFFSRQQLLNCRRILLISRTDQTPFVTLRIMQHFRQTGKLAFKASYTASSHRGNATCPGTATRVVNSVLPAVM